MLSSELLEILVCPESKQDVRLADTQELSDINRRISEGTMANVSGGLVAEAVEGVLIRRDAKVGYPIREGIPVMLIDEGLVL